MHVLLDCRTRRRTLWFKDARSQGRFVKAFDGLPAGKLYPAVTLYRGNACRLV